MSEQVLKDPALNYAFFVILYGAYDERERGGVLETLKEKDAELAALKAENQRLTAALKDMEREMLAEHQAAVDMFGKYDEQRDENAKLREALQQREYRE